MREIAWRGIQLFFAFVLVILNAVLQATGNCQLEQHLLDEWRIPIAYENESLALLRTIVIQNNTILFLVCNNEDTTEVSCVNGQLSPELSMGSCPNVMLPQYKLQNYKKLCEYNLYQVGFQIECLGKSYFLESYQVCFDFDRKRAVFAINTAYPFVKSRPKGMQFDPDGIFTMNVFSAYNKRAIYATFKEILGQGQTFMPDNANDLRIDRGHLTPAGDYITNNLIATTFKMINVIPQFHTINSGNWKAMEEWARNPINTPAKVCSGAFPWVLKLPDGNNTLREIYLKDKLIPVPLWTYKIVLNRNGIRTVFLQYNNIHDKQMPPQIPNGICQETPCPSNIKLLKSNDLGYTVCCTADHFMTNTVPNLLGHC